MRKEYRLTKDVEYKRVRSEGQSFPHPLLILGTAPNTHLLPHEEQPVTRWGFTVGRKLGKAVQRNRSRRLLREAARHIHPQVRPGYDIVLVGRSPLAESKMQDVYTALEQLLRRARLLALPKTPARQHTGGESRKDA